MHTTRLIVPTARRGARRGWRRSREGIRAALFKCLTDGVSQRKGNVPEAVDYPLDDAEREMHRTSMSSVSGVARSLASDMPHKRSGRNAAV
jgi:hypothetical protein